MFARNKLFPIPLPLLCWLIMYSHFITTLVMAVDNIACFTLVIRSVFLVISIRDTCSQQEDRKYGHLTTLRAPGHCP